MFHLLLSFLRFCVNCVYTLQTNLTLILLTFDACCGGIKQSVCLDMVLCEWLCAIVSLSMRESVCESIFHLYSAGMSAHILMKLIAVNHYQVHMTLKRSLGQRATAVQIS